MDNEEKNFLFGFYVRQKPIFDFLKKHNINIDKSKINFQHVVLINWIKHLYEVRQISNFNDNFGNDYVYISKSFVKKQLPLLNVSTNTETKLFNDLKDIGILNIIIQENSGNRRYVGLTKEMIKIFNDNNRVIPSESFKKDLKFWENILKEFGKFKDFERWVINFDCKYIEDQKEMILKDLKKYFYNYLKQCKENI